MNASTPSARLRMRWLDALLPLVPFDGWTETAASTAAETAGLTDGECALAAPRGIADLVDAFFDTAEQTARTSLAGLETDNLGVRDKVAAGITTWLDALAPNKEAARRAAARGFLPWVAGDAIQRTWSVADMIWTAIGDTSTDYNRYSKRGLLASTLPLIFMRWLDEDDPDRLDAYIRRRLTQAMTLGRASGRIAGPILSALDRLRTGSDRQ